MLLVIISSRWYSIDAISRSDSSSRPCHRDSSSLHTSLQLYDGHDEAASDNADIPLAPSQDSQVLYGTSFDPHHHTNADNLDNITTSQLHVPASYDVGSALQTESYTLHETGHSQYSLTPTDSTWGTGDQHFITSSDTLIQYDTSSDYQDNQVQLQQWAYQTSNSHLTVAEKFEKANWETKRHEKL
jgi:hypothetical protein